MIFGEILFYENALEIFKNSTVHCRQIHYPFVMFEAENSHYFKLLKNVSDKYFFQILLHKCINQPES